MSRSYSEIRIPFSSRYILKITVTKYDAYMYLKPFLTFFRFCLTRYFDHRVRYHIKLPQIIFKGWQQQYSFDEYKIFWNISI